MSDGVFVPVQQNQKQRKFMTVLLSATVCKRFRIDVFTWHSLNYRNDKQPLAKIATVRKTAPLQCFTTSESSRNSEGKQENTWKRGQGDTYGVCLKRTGTILWGGDM